MVIKQRSFLSIGRSRTKIPEVVRVVERVDVENIIRCAKRKLQKSKSKSKNEIESILNEIKKEIRKIEFEAERKPSDLKRIRHWPPFDPRVKTPLRLKHPSSLF